jgi:hypothetical protein
LTDFKKDRERKREGGREREQKAKAWRLRDTRQAGKVAHTCNSSYLGGGD